MLGSLRVDRISTCYLSAPLSVVSRRQRRRSVTSGIDDGAGILTRSMSRRSSDVVASSSPRSAVCWAHHQRQLDIRIVIHDRDRSGLDECRAVRLVEVWLRVQPDVFVTAHPDFNIVGSRSTSTVDGVGHVLPAGDRNGLATPVAVSSQPLPAVRCAEPGEPNVHGQSPAAREFAACRQRRPWNVCGIAILAQPRTCVTVIS